MLERLPFSALPFWSLFCLTAFRGTQKLKASGSAFREGVGAGLGLLWMGSSLFGPPLFPWNSVGCFQVPRRGAGGGTDPEAGLQLPAALRGEFEVESKSFRRGAKSKPLEGGSQKVFLLVQLA